MYVYLCSKNKIACINKQHNIHKVLFGKFRTFLEATRFKAWVCGRSLPGVAGSNPGCVSPSLASVACVKVEVSATAHHLCKGVLLSVMCLSMIEEIMMEV